MSWYASLTAAVMGSGASASDRPDQKMRKVRVASHLNFFSHQHDSWISLVLVS